jgi:hypothetical protein
LELEPVDGLLAFSHEKVRGNGVAEKLYVGRLRRGWCHGEDKDAPHE